jgi:Small-conductance mechanosensitive channel
LDGSFISNHPIMAGSLIIAGSIGVGLVLWLLVTKTSDHFSRKCTPPKPMHWLRGLALPLALLVLAAFVDDALDIAALRDAWWYDEAVAAVRSLAVVSWTWFLTKQVRSYFARQMEKRWGQAGTVHAMGIINNLATLLLLIGGAFLLLNVWHISLTPLLASAGLVTAAVALASREALSNLFGGISIILDRPFYVGDYVRLDSGERGEVVHIGLRSTRILTRDDIVISVPNALLANSRVINETQQVPRSRVRCQVGVAYDSDPAEVERVLLDSLRGNRHVLHSPEPRVRFRQFGDSSLMVELQAWIGNPEVRGQTLDLMIRSALTSLRAAGISIPFPQREVTLKDKAQPPEPPADRQPDQEA